METKVNDAGPNVQEMQVELGKLKTDLATMQKLAHEREQKMLALQKASDHAHSTLEHVKADLETSVKSKNEWRYRAKIAEDTVKELRERINSRAAQDNKVLQRAINAEIDAKAKQDCINDLNSSLLARAEQAGIIQSHLSEMLDAIHKEIEIVQENQKGLEDNLHRVEEERDELEKKHIALIVGVPESEVHKLSVTPAQAMEIIEAKDSK